MERAQRLALELTLDDEPVSNGVMLGVVAQGLPGEREARPAPLARLALGLLLAFAAPLLRARALLAGPLALGLPLGLAGGLLAVGLFDGGELLAALTRGALAHRLRVLEHGALMTPAEQRAEHEDHPHEHEGGHEDGQGHGDRTSRGPSHRARSACG